MVVAEQEEDGKEKRKRGKGRGRKAKGVIAGETWISCVDVK